MEERLWRFIDNQGSFVSDAADKIKGLYFPLANEAIMSSVTPDLHGDVKTGQDSFLLQPVSRIDLSNLRSARNFWVYVDHGKMWSCTGVSKDGGQIQEDSFRLDAGLLWHKLTRENKKIGLRAEILSFVPSSNEPVEIMQVTLTNVAARRIKFIPTAAIPIYGRGANSLRDHRHVTSLLQRIRLSRFGVIVKPTLAFDEAGHKPNKTNYFVLGWEADGRPPQYLYPTQEMFCGEEGDLEAPVSILEQRLSVQERMQGKEAMGALRFREAVLHPGQAKTYIILLGITEDAARITQAARTWRTADKVNDAVARTKKYWVVKSQEISLSTGDHDFDNWLRWVSIQPTLRRIFGCSFLPDFDYGKGGRGWRDLWQDCLGLILANPEAVRGLLINNFSGVRIDGSNATIIGKKPGEFIADRNDLARVWMDHGIWPLLSLDVYLNETGDFGILFEETAYFRDQHIFRSRLCDRDWKPSEGNRLKTASGKIYQGTVFEHLLVQILVQFFNVGVHNHVRLEGADWNDGLDMARERGESVAFSTMYAHHLALLAQVLTRTGRPKIEIAEELKMLLREMDYDNARAKQRLLERYFTKTKSGVSGKKFSIDNLALARNLKAKSNWMMGYIRQHEWLKEGFFNGYYDNQGQRVEGRKGKVMRMLLASQVFAIMSGVATDEQIRQVWRSIRTYLFDKKLKGYHLNTDFKEEQHHFGRAFSFIYGDKENGAYFNHMIVMFAYAMFKRGYAREGWQVLNSIYAMAVNTAVSKIYPCIPEYFNLEGRGMYSYLTGSASWFVLTLLTQGLGIRGQNGDLLIAPNVCSGHFKTSPLICLSRVFAGRTLQINLRALKKPFFNALKLSNPRKISRKRCQIVKAVLNSRPLPLPDPHCLVITRKTICALPAGKINTLDIILHQRL